MPPTAPDPSMEQRLRGLRRAYAEQLPHRVGQIEALIGRWQPDNRAETLRSLRLMAHSLAGSSAVFGFPELSDRARRLAELAGRCETRAEPETDERFRLERLASSLREADRSTVRGGEAESDPEESLDFEPSKSRRLVFLVTTDGALASDLAFQLGCFGYLPRVFSGFAEVMERLHESPATVILDADPFTAVLEEVRQFERRFSGRAVRPPVVLLSRRSDLHSRLEAVRAGVDAFVSSPPDVRRLLEQLDLLTHSRPREPYRVLVVHGRYSEGLQISLSLQQGGASVTLVTQPDQALKELVDFQPDVLLMNLELPEVTGPELAAIVRQSDAYLHLPIVFLAPGASLQNQLEAMRSGADDLIDDPADVEATMAVVRFHAQRARSVRWYGTHDSLTGVLNHTELMQRLHAQFEHSSRHGRPLAYVHLDIDELQTVNDLYGFLTGDAVIKSLAGLLVQRLRRTDVIGRYGGEEFALILPDTGVEAARRVLDEIRSLFAELPHRTASESFFATFSAGVSGLPGFDDPLALHEDARAASRLARDSGGNRVVLARP